MAKDKHPAEFPTAWHHERHLEDLERELAGRLGRLEELKALNAHQDLLAQTEAEADAVRDQLTQYGVTTKSTRPRAAREKR